VPKYRELTIPAQNLSGDDIHALNQFNAEFDPSDVFVEVVNDSVVIHLSAVDYKKLESFVQSMSAGENGILADVKSKLDSVRSYGLDSGRRLYVGYNAERKVANRKAKEKTRKKHYYANNHGFSTTNVDVPREFVDKLICGDSEEVLKQLPDNCVDIVFTSPPYNFGLDYGDQEDSHYWQSYFDKLFRVFAECIRVVKYGGRIVVNVQPLFSDYIPSHHVISSFFMENNLIWKGEILWEKNNYNCKYTAWGSWKSPSSPYLKYTWEFVEVFTKGTLKKKGDADNIDITAEEFKDWVVARWSIAPERNMKAFGHPAMFPEELVERVLKLFSYQEDLVLDPFNGVGTTSVVAKRLNRHFLGIDVSPEYTDTAVQRVRREDTRMLRDEDPSHP